MEQPVWKEYSSGFSVCNPSFTNCPRPRTFDFDSDGVARFSFYKWCPAGKTESPNFVTVINHETEAWCRVSLNWVCQNGWQQISVETPEDDSICQVAPDQRQDSSTQFRVCDRRADSALEDMWRELMSTDP